MFIALLTGLVNRYYYTKCISLRNQKWLIQHALINWHPNAYSHEFHYCLFAVKLDRCVWNCNTLNDIHNKVCIPNKTEDLISKPVQHEYKNKWIENINVQM